MAFQDDFAACMADAGISMDAGVVPDAQTLGPVIDYIKQWIGGLDQGTVEGIDEATAPTGPSSVALSDPSVGIVDPAYQGLLEAFDNASGFSLSLCLQWCEHCASQAAAGQQ